VASRLTLVAFFNSFAAFVLSPHLLRLSVSVYHPSPESFYLFLRRSNVRSVRSGGVQLPALCFEILACVSLPTSPRLALLRVIFVFLWSYSFPFSFSVLVCLWAEAFTVVIKERSLAGRSPTCLDQFEVQLFLAPSCSPFLPHSFDFSLDTDDFLGLQLIRPTPLPFLIPPFLSLIESFCELPILSLTPFPLSYPLSRREELPLLPPR